MPAACPDCRASGHGRILQPRVPEHDTTLRRSLDLSGKRCHFRSAGLRPDDSVSGARGNGQERDGLLSRAAGTRPAGQRRLGYRARPLEHAQRHPSRCALSLSQHDERIDGRARARDHHRRGATGLVLPAGRETGFHRPSRWLRRYCSRRRSGAFTHRSRPQTARNRRGQYPRGAALRATRLCIERLRHGPRRHPVPARTWRPVDRHRCVELGCAVRAYGQEIRRDARRIADLGGAQGGSPYRLLPSGKAPQPRGAAASRFFVSCFPHKIRGASAGWTRAVAIFDDALNATA